METVKTGYARNPGKGRKIFRPYKAVLPLRQAEMTETGMLKNFHIFSVANHRLASAF
jgi:hypothetical protein